MGQQQKRPLSRRAILGLSVLAVGAFLSVVVTRNTAWWPWADASLRDEQFGSDPSDTTSTETQTPATTQPQTSPPAATSVPAKATSGQYFKKDLPITGVPTVLQEKLNSQGGVIRVYEDGSSLYTNPTGSENITASTSGAIKTITGEEARALSEAQRSEKESVDSKAKPSNETALAPCVKPQGSLIDPCVNLRTNIQTVYKESISLMLLLAFLVLVYAGYRYVTSLGNPEQTKDAKDWAVSAVAGIALLLLIPLLMQALGVGPSAETSNENTTSAPETGTSGTSSKAAGSESEDIEANPSTQTGGGVSTTPSPASQGTGSTRDTVPAD